MSRCKSQTGRLSVSGVLTEAIPPGGDPIGSVNVGTSQRSPLARLLAGDTNIGNVDVLTMPAVTIGAMPNLVESLADDAAFTPGHQSRRARGVYLRRCRVRYRG